MQTQNFANYANINFGTRKKYHYKVTLYNDMGHLLCTPENLPEHIRAFVDSKVKLYVRNATDLTGRCAFYILGPNLQKTYNYYYNNDIVTITYDLDLFNSQYMKFR